MQREKIADALQHQVGIDPQPSDHELLMWIQQREEQALGLLYDRYAGLVYRIALRMTGDRAVVEEVTQDVFLAV